MTDETLRHTLPDGAVLTGRRWGTAAPELLFVGGNGFTAATYGPALAQAAADRPTVALNPRGMGGSTVPDAFPGFATWVADLQHAVTTLATPPVLLGGHSLGAVLAVMLAVQAPELVRGLVLLDPLIMTPRGEAPSEAFEAGLQELIERTERRRDVWPSREEAATELAGRGAYKSWASEPFAGFVAEGLAPDDAGVRLACPPWLEVAVYRARPGGELMTWAERLTQPVAILRGADSATCHPTGAEQFAESVAIGSVLTLAGGHLFPMERPDPTARAVAEAVRMLGRGQPAAPTAVEG